MKNRLIATVITVLLSTSILFADEIGIRGNFGTNSGGELSYRKRVAKKSRVELGFGINNSNFGVAAAYQWVFGISGGWRWFIGPAMTANFNDGISLDGGGQVGLEFDFNSINIPLKAGIDIRPMFIANSKTIMDDGAALSLRFTF